MPLSRDDITRESFPMPANIGLNSEACHLHRISGRLTFSPHDYAPPGIANYFSNIFQVFGLVELKALYGQFTAAGDTTDGPSHCYFTFDDGAAAMDLTSGTPGVGGVDCANAIVGATILKNAAAADVAVYLAGDQARVSELTVGGAARPFFSALLQAKPTVATNYIRFNYSDAAADNTFSITWIAIWACRYPGSYIVAV